MMRGSLRALIPKAINTVTILGGGIMGSGIATVCVLAGKRVRVVDIDDARLKATRDSISEALTFVATKERKLKTPPKCPGDTTAASRVVNGGLSLVELTTDLKKAVTGADFVLESVVENMKIKHDVLGKVNEFNPECIVATNTSSMLVRDVMKPITDKKRTAGLHFFSPAHRMPLVEVIAAPDTAKETFDVLFSFSKNDLKKTTVRAADTPGFIVNRLLVPNMLEAMRMVERGDATVADIDAGMQGGAGYPMGPFQVADMVGLDTVQHIIDSFHALMPENPLFKPSTLLNKLVAEGKLGRKNGEGFYKY